MANLKSSYKTIKRAARHARIRAKVRGTSVRPRLCVFRSNQAIYVQLIDDEKGLTLAAADSRRESGPLSKRAEAVGVNIAKQAIAKNIAKAVFDRGGFRYQGAVAKLAEAARKQGLSL
jgi:large subunit ribosomal protein L18